MLIFKFCQGAGDDITVKNYEKEIHLSFTKKGVKNEGKDNLMPFPSFDQTRSSRLFVKRRIPFAKIVYTISQMAASAMMM